MKLARFSIAHLLLAVAVCGFAMACLLCASAPWAAGLYSIALGLLDLALKPIITSMTQADEDRLRRDGGNVFVQKPGEASPTLLVANAQFLRFSVPGKVARVLISEPEHARITKAFNAQWDVFLEPTPAKPLAAWWSSRPVQSDQFNEVGHASFTLLFSWLGGALGRHMHATRAVA
jgi:hypothetical protein